MKEIARAKKNENLGKWGRKSLYNSHRENTFSNNSIIIVLSVLACMRVCVCVNILNYSFYLCY